MAKLMPGHLHAYLALIILHPLLDAKNRYGADRFPDATKILGRNKE